MEGSGAVGATPSGGGEPGHAGGNTIKLFPPAAPPNIIRAEQKDEVYLQQLVDACHDVIRRLLGPRAALVWYREVRLLAELLYYTLTTGSGLQTLGEEYCDVLQVTGRVGVPPGTLRRGVLVLLQSLGPYVADVALPSASEGGQAWQPAAEPLSRQRNIGQPGWGASIGAPQLLPGAAAAALRASLRAGVQTAAARWPAAAGLLAQHGGSLLRLHLALFYISGTFYMLSKRATGVRHIFIGRMLGGRPVYSALGYLLLLQLAVAAAMILAGRSRPTRGVAGAAPRARDRLQPAALLDAEGKQVVDLGPTEPTEAAAQREEVAPPPKRRCPLCLSARDHPTATPCGHVFCWGCIVEWVGRKPECPLCRSEVRLPSLVCLRHCDF